MTDAQQPFCVARAIRQVAPELIEESVVLDCFEGVVEHLRRIYAWFADSIADRRAMSMTEGPAAPLGGFGVRLRNRWGGEVEVGVGREIWFLFRHEPKPSKCFSDSPEVATRWFFT